MINSFLTTAFRAFTLISAFFLFSYNASAQQAGDLDATFNPSDIGLSNGDGPNDFISTSAIQNDGKLLVAGIFYTYNGIASNALARLNSDGTLDETFDIGTGPNNLSSVSSISKLAVQPDGKVLVVGTFTSFNGYPRNRIVRLNSDGSIDQTFNIGSGVAGTSVNALTIQSDGKIIIGGSFTKYNGVTRNRIARLNVDGSLDSSFDPAVGPSNTVYSILILANGRYLIGGSFSNYNGVPRKGAACINPDGTLFSSFNPGTSISIIPSSVTGPPKILDIKEQPDGKFILVGDFTHFNGVMNRGIVRLNVDGSLDISFQPRTNQTQLYTIYSAQLQSDGKILIDGFGRLNSDGSKDLGFNTGGSGVDNAVFDVKLLTNGKIVYFGIFQNYNYIPRRYIACLKTDGTFDSSFMIGTGANDAVAVSAIQSDGKILIGGNFNGYNGKRTGLFTRLNTDGTLDTSFITGLGARDGVGVYSILIQPDNKIIIGGDFGYYNNSLRGCIVRLNANGTIDATFNAGSLIGPRIRKMLLQPDGKIIVLGRFSSSSPTSIENILRLNSDGSLDNTFTTSGTNDEILTGCLQPDGKIVIGGAFTAVNGIVSRKIARLNSNGSLELSFNVGPGGWDIIEAIELQSDGKLILGGAITTFNGQVHNNILRLNQDGTIDNTFITGTGASNNINELHLQSDGKILIAGSFLDYNGFTCNHFARLNSNGSFDSTFNPGAGTAGFVNSISIQSDGKIVIGGNFTSFNGIGKNRLTRLFGSGSTQSSIITGQLSFTSICQGSTSSIPFSASGTFSTGNIFTAQLSNASGSFASPVVIGTLTGTTSGTILATIPGTTPGGTGYRIRVVSSSPATVSTGNGSNLTILSAPVQPTASAFSRCGTGPVTLTASGSGSGVSYKWYSAATNGTLLFTGSTYITPTLSATATYYVEASNGTCSSTRKAVQAIINPIPVTPAAATSVNSFYLGSSTTLSVASPVNGVTYTWTGNGLSSTTGTSVTAIPVSVGTQTYTVTANANGCSSTAGSVSVQVYAPLLTPSIAGSPFCAGKTVPVSYSFVNNPVFITGNVFTAQLSDAAGSFAAPVVIGTRTSTAAGTITATLPATAVGTGYRIRVVSSTPAYTGSDNGSNLTILAAPSPLTTTSAYFCNNTPGSSTLTVSGGGNSVVGYNWYTTSTGGTPFHTGTSYATPVVTTTKTWYVAAVNNNGCESPKRKGAAVYITPAFSVSASPASVAVPVGSSTMLTASASIAGVTYKWSPATGLNTTVGDTVIASPSVTTIYTLTGTKLTCTTTTTVTVTVTCPGPLAGSYSINKNAVPSATNFTSFKTFADRISLCGVSGPVTVNVAANSGPYTEQVEFGQIPGVSSTRTVTLNGNGNTLQFAPGSSNNYLLRLNGMDYFRLQNLTLTSTADKYGWGVHLYNGAEHNVISNCTINLSQATTAASLNGIVASALTTAANGAGATVSDLQLINNTINGGYYGISICGLATAKAAEVTMTGNSVNNAYFAGAYLFNLDGAQVYNNTISIRPGYINGYGLFLNGIDNGFAVQKNKITGFGKYGINLTNCNSTTVTVRAQVSNNMIGGGVQNSTAATYGLYLNNADRVDLWYNSVNLDQGYTNSAACYVLASSGAMDVRNNSFAFSGTTASYAFYAPATSLTTLDYNNYYSSGSNFVFLSGDKIDLAVLKAAAAPAGHDQHSYQGNPIYLSATNLHVQAASSQLANRGVAIAGMTSDIDGNARATSPDIGADEYASPARMMAMGASGSVAASAYPNPIPAGVNLQVSVTAQQPGHVQYVLTDLVGRVVMNVASQVEAGSSVQTLDMSTLCKGLYILNIQQVGQSTQVKIVKE